jgi:hypothetical protein
MSPVPNAERSLSTVHLLVQGTLQVRRFDLPDPCFFYVRWSGQFQIVDVYRNRVIGALHQSGKEGHVAEREAINRVKTIMRQVLILKLVTKLKMVLCRSNE